uniref:Uncharacterized protein n=1 Tax=Polysiphonia sertularioides TaxID=945028 RepID=A0A1Z1M8Z6_9FLOR|nr:hypothetical protein [Polysiphonia sertularioides]ARW62439.1 hypothetical protein [Polysiphonia sertularioides]
MVLYISYKFMQYYKNNVLSLSCLNYFLYPNFFY